MAIKTALEAQWRRWGEAGTRIERVIKPRTEETHCNESLPGSGRAIQQVFWVILDN